MDNKEQSTKSKSSRSLLSEVLGILSALVRVVRILFGTGFVTLVTSVLLFFLILSFGPVEVPRWITDRVAANVSEGELQLDLSKSEVYAWLGPRLTPQVQLDRVKVTSSGEAIGYHFEQVEASISLSHLLVGRIALQKLSIDGLLVNLSRQADGRLEARLGNGAASRSDQTAVANWRETLGYALDLPQLVAFQELTLRNVTLAYQDFRAQETLTVDGGRINVSRDQETLSLQSDFAVLAGGAGVASIEANSTFSLSEGSLEFGLNFIDLPSRLLASQSTGFVWLSSLKAPLSGALRGGIAANGELLPLNAALDIGAGALQPNETSAPLFFERAQAYFSYDDQQKKLTFDTIRLESDDLSLSAEGNALVENDDWSATSLLGQFTLKDVNINPRQSLNEPIQIAFANVDFRLRPDPFTLDIRQLYFEDQTKDLNAHFAAKVEVDEAGWNLSSQLHTDRILARDVLHYWHPDLKPQNRDWLDRNVKAGALRDVNYALKYNPVTGPRTDIAFMFENAEFQILEDYPLLRNASGLFASREWRMSLVIDEGVISAPGSKDVDLSGTEFLVRDTKTKPSLAEITLAGGGMTNDIVSLLQHAPLNLFQNLDLSQDQFDADVRFETALAFPLKKGLKLTDIDYTGTARLSDLSLRVAPQISQVRSEKIDLKFANEGCSAIGVFLLDNIPLYMNGKMEFAERTTALDFSFDLNEALLASLNISLPNGLVEGSAPAVLRFTSDQSASRRLVVDSDLLGVNLNMSQLNWQKSKQSALPFQLRGEIQQSGKLDIQSVSLNGQGLLLDARPNRDGSGMFAGLAFERFRLDDMIDVSGEISEEKGLLITGGQFDARPFLQGERTPNRTAQADLPAKIQLDRIRLGKKITLTDFRGDLVLGRALSGPFSAKLSRSSVVQGRFFEKNGRTGVEATSAQGGPTLVALGATKEATGGDFALRLTPSRTPRVLDGYVKLTNVKVQQAPVLAEILNAISIVGLIELLSGPGLPLNEIEGTFRLNGDELILKNGTAFGPSLGVSLDGYFNTKTEIMDLQGVLSPIYAFNAIGSLLTKKGEGLLGFNFTLKGKAGRAKLVVNPLSIFTPAMFRNIFRRPAPKYSD